MSADNGVSCPMGRVRELRTVRHIGRTFLADLGCCSRVGFDAGAHCVWSIDEQEAAGCKKALLGGEDRFEPALLATIEVQVGIDDVLDRFVLRDERGGVEDTRCDEVQKGRGDGSVVAVAHADGEVLVHGLPDRVGHCLWAVDADDADTPILADGLDAPAGDLRGRVAPTSGDPMRLMAISRRRRIPPE